VSQSHRLESGGRINRNRPVEFSFNGKTYSGFEGDTIASALLANGVHLIARSFKYHRPRGIMGSGPEDPSGMLQIGTGDKSTPNPRATQSEIYPGLQAFSVNVFFSVSHDAGSLMRLFSPLLAAGFYYKTFMYPKKGWKFYEKSIRKAAGFGIAESQNDPDRYEKTNAWCDVLVAGAGAAGLAAALAAARLGARVIIADQSHELGGSLLRNAKADEREWLNSAVDELQRFEEVRILPRTAVSGYYDDNFLILNERITDHQLDPPADQARERIWRVRAKQVVLAGGAIERPLVFANNDKPGVMLASAVSEYIHRYAVAPGKRAVVFTNNDSAYQSVISMHDAGIDVAAVVDARAKANSPIAEKLESLEIPVFYSSVVVRAKGRQRVNKVIVMQLSDDFESVSGPSRQIECDLLCVSGGWSPAVHLHAQSGGKPRFEREKACFVPGDAVQSQFSAGAANGTFATHDCVEEGRLAGTQAAVLCGFQSPGDDSQEQIGFDGGDGYSIQPLWVVPSDRAKDAGRQFVDFQNDTTVKDIALAAAEGYRSIEHVKRYTLLGFGTDQGKLGNINGMAILSKILKQDIAQTGTTTYRPFYTPITFGAIAGREIGDQFFDPVRKTALHQWHVDNGALFENVGQWKRPWYYPRDGETMHEAVSRECLAARKQVAMLDASTLGKIEIFGPDAVEFLNCMYTNSWSKLSTGSCRYGLMLGEDGMVMDDGVTAKLGDNHYYMTTTTGGAAHVLTWMERWRQTEWPKMKVYFTSVTDQWAVIAIAGPKAREVVARIAPELDVSNEAFPFMSFRDAWAASVRARVFRVSFSGELSYEINVPANYAVHVWKEVYKAGQEFGITPYGTETMHVLRAEKGFIIVGQDTDGSVTPVDLGMNWIVSKNKDFLGKRSLQRVDCVRPDRKQLVGLLTDDPNKVLPEGAQLVNEPSESRPVPMIGHVTSSYWSATLGRSIALAMVKGGQSRTGARIYSCLMNGETVAASICSPVFYDPQGARQNV